jgi:hypothetical protein
MLLHTLTLHAREKLGLMLALAVLLVAGTARADANDQPLRIDNGVCAVEYDPASGTFSAWRGEKQFIGRATFGDFFKAKEATAQVTQTGEGEARVLTITIEHPSGHAAALMLHGKAPLVMLTSAIKNLGDTPLNLQEILPFIVPVSLGPAPGESRLLGYDGLCPADQAKTCYLYLAIADPITRAGVVGGWLTQERASGLVRSSVEGGGVRLEGLSQYGRKQVAPGETVVGETLALGYFDDVAEGLEQYADEIAQIQKIKVRPVPSGYMTWYHAGALDEKRMSELAKWSAENLKKYGFDFLQIDDGWQLSRRDFTNHNPSGPYPGGMQATAEAITRQGLMAGLWITPFGWDHKRPVLADHLDWFVRRADGSVYEVTWGGDSLDMSNPEARKFLHDVVDRIANQWGCKFFKLDALWAGLAVKILYPDPHYRPDDFGDAVFHDPKMSNVEAYRAGLKTVREAAGPEAYLLGCTAAQNMRTLQASIGLVDGMRVGVDSGRKWTGILENVKTATSVYFLHGRVWHNDPDVLYLDDNFSLDQIRAWASWLAVSGQLYMVSNWLPDVAAERLEVVRRTIPNHNRHARPLDLLQNSPAQVWHLCDRPSNRHILALFNWDGAEKSVAVDLAKLVPDGSSNDKYVGFDFWEGEVVDPLSGILGAKLRPTSCHVIALRPVVDHPQVVSTSRHVTQGVLDLSGEEWDAGEGLLSGVSRVVAGDPYELRISVPDAATKASVIGISPDDKAAGVTTSGKQEGTWVRVVLNSPKNREVSWQITFTK